MIMELNEVFLNKYINRSGEYRKLLNAMLCHIRGGQ